MVDSDSEFSFSLNLQYINSSLKSIMQMFGSLLVFVIMYVSFVILEGHLFNFQLLMQLVIFIWSVRWKS